MTANVRWDYTPDGMDTFYRGLRLAVSRPRRDLPLPMWSGSIDGQHCGSASSASGCRKMLIEMADKRADKIVAA